MVDVPAMEAALYGYLSQKDNVSIACDQEITAIEKDPVLKGNVGCIRSGYGGKSSGSFAVDALVLCDGWNTSQLLSKHLGYSVPVLPVKQYSLRFDSEAMN